MATLAQIATYASGAGWSGQDLITAIAVCMAESGGNENLVDDVSIETAEWGPSIGLWQIRSRNAEKGKGTERDEIANKDPATNAVHAHAIQVKDGWKAWSAYNNKKYLLYVPIATTAAANVVPVLDAGHAAESAANAVVNPILTIAEEPIKVLKWLQQPGTQTRIAKLVVGAALVMIGLSIFAKPVVDQATDTVNGMIPKVIPV